MDKPFDLAAEDASVDAPLPASLSLGAKLLLIATALLCLSMGVCAGVIQFWARHFTALHRDANVAAPLLILWMAGTIALFALGFFFSIEWLLNRPLRNILATMTELPSGSRPVSMNLERRDEWGILGSTLNRYAASLWNLQERTSVLYEASRMSTASTNFREALDSVFTGLLHRYRLTSCLLFVFDGETLAVEASAGVSKEFVQGLRPKPGEGVVGQTYSSGVLRYVGSVENETDPLLQDIFKRQPLGAALFIPMKAGGDVIGTAVYLTQPLRKFKGSQIDSLSAFTDHLSLAFRNGRRLRELRSTNERLELELATTVRELQQTQSRLIHKARELKTVHELALATTATNQVNDIVDVMIRGVKELVEIQEAAFFQLGPGSALTPLGPTFGRSAGSLAAASADESPFLQRVLRDEKAQILNFVDDGEPLPAAWKGLGIRSILALPLRQGPDVSGLFCAINKINGLFSEDDSRVLSLLMNRVSEVLQRMILDDQLRQQVSDLKVLQEISARLPNPPVLTDTVAAIARSIRASLPGTELCLFFTHQTASETVAFTGGAWDETSIAFDPNVLSNGVSEKTPLAEVFRTGESLHFQRGSATAGWKTDALLSAVELYELLYLPLTVERGTVGVMALGRRREEFFTLEQRRLAHLIAKQVAIIIERSRLYESLRAANGKLEQVNHLKNEFISMVSHELRTPLTTIKGFVSIVLNEETGPLNDQQMRFLKISDRAIDRLTLLVSDLLDISRIEAGQIKMQLRPMSMKDVIQQVAGGFAPQFKAQQLTLELQLPEQLPNVLADPNRVTQVLDNLISNALKYTERGGVTVTTLDKGDFVLTSVRDSGHGISKAEQDRIFEKFYQIKMGGGYPAKGTGLGLAIVRSIVESHRGKVWVESEPGKGSVFHFLLPRAKMDEEAMLSKASVL